MFPRLTRLLYPSLFIAAVLFGSTAFAAPIEIEADSVTHNQKSGTSVYTGNVRIASDGMVLTGDKVEVFSEEGKVSKVVAQAKPSRFNQKKDSMHFQAQALKIEYLVKKSVIKLYGDVQIKEKDKTFIGEQAVYDVEKQIFVSQKKGERIKLILESADGKSAKEPAKQSKSSQKAKKAGQAKKAKQPKQPNKPKRPRAKSNDNAAKQ